LRCNIDSRGHFAGLSKVSLRPAKAIVFDAVSVILAFAIDVARLGSPPPESLRNTKSGLFWAANTLHAMIPDCNLSKGAVP
jgi:hypothetical protein